jgi:PhoPQ-activated pathogenicity-related protein
LNWAKKNLTKEQVNKLLVATNKAGWTVFLCAITFSRVEVLQGILNSAKENMTKDELN